MAPAFCLHGLQADLTPPFQKWADIIPGVLVQEGREELMKRFAVFRDVSFAALQISSFDTAVNEFYLDLTIGTAVMFVDDGDDDVPVRFMTVPQSQCAFDEGPYGTIDAIFRTQKMIVRVADRTWGDEITAAGWAAKVEKHEEEELTLHECTYFHAGVWYYEILMEGTLEGTQTEDGVTRIVEREYGDESPWIVTRWIKVPGEIQGRGPVLFALPDAKTLNKVKELILKNASIATSGVWIARDDGVLNPNKVSIQPGKVIAVGSTGGAFGASLQPLEFRGNFDVSQLLTDQLTIQIKQAMLDQQLPPDAQAAQATATFIVERIKELQQDIGSPFGRIMSEFIRPLFQKLLNALARKGVLATPDGKPFKVNGAFMDIQVMSPLAQGQNLSDLQRAVQWAQINQGINPQGFMLGAKFEEFPAWTAEKLGVDKALVRSKAERQQVEQQIGTVMGQQMAANENGGGVPVGAPTGGVPVQQAA